MSYLLTEKLTSTIVMYMILKRLLKDWTEWDAYKNGIIDKDGKRLRKPRTSKEREGWDILDRFCWSMKRLTTKFIGDKKFVYLFSTAYLMKEDCSIIVKQNFDKYKKELDDFSVSHQQTLHNMFKEIDNGLIIESKLGIETNIIKIQPKIKLLLNKYDIESILESVIDTKKTGISFLIEDGEVATTVGDIAQFTPVLGTPIKKKLNIKCISNRSRILKRRRYKWQQSQGTKTKI